MYEAVHAYPEGQSTAARFALTANRMGYDGIILRNHSEFDTGPDIERVRDKFGMDVVTGIEIRSSDFDRVRGLLGQYRKSHCLVLVHGGDTRLNRLAVEDDRVDVLAHPMAKDGDFNHVFARVAADNGVRIEFSFGSVLRRSGGARVQAITDLRKLRRIVMHYDVPYVISADPTVHLQLRAPRELTAVGEMIGFSAVEIANGLAEWGTLAARNREIRSDNFIEPGIKRTDMNDVERPRSEDEGP